MPTLLNPGQRRQPKQLRSRLMVETIVEAAHQVFSEHGFEGATTNQIAERAGISIGSLYQYFPNKDALILDVQRRHHEDVLTTVKNAMQLSGVLPLRDAIRSVIAANLDMHLQSPKLHAAFEEWIPAESKLVDRDGFRKEMATVIRAFLSKRPEIAQAAPLDQTVFVIMNMVRSVMHASVRDQGSHVDRTKVIDTLTDSLLGCLQPVCVGR
ncbi:TetR/AcrR family transcriptional regulator [Labrenzia sp. VG12]|uniref:TetR/AcrR family transcriptional regulator n=1 Tax=Labrenzia sp. VG12 TaxID=2021862 RepID=UPI0012FDC6E1|nr:TetR/AcrR family transcriptional regulator [Labrenzia sp. VG12]